MLLKLVLPVANEALPTARIDAVHISSAQQLMPGARLIDFTVGVDAGTIHDCPPITHYRMTLRERASVVRIDAAEGESLAAGATLALLATEPGDDAATDPVRSARVSVAAIMRAPDW